MSDAKRRHDWDIGATIVAKIHNMHIANESDLINPATVHPFMDDVEITNIVPVCKKIQMGALKALGGIK